MTNLDVDDDEFRADVSIGELVGGTYSWRRLADELITERVSLSCSVMLLPIRSSSIKDHTILRLCSDPGGFFFSLHSFLPLLFPSDLGLSPPPSLFLLFLGWIRVVDYLGAFIFNLF